MYVYKQTTHLHCCGHYFVSNGEKLRRELVDFEIESHYAGENANHGVITEGINAKNIKVPQEAGCHRIPPTTRWAHSCEELDVDEGDL